MATLNLQVGASTDDAAQYLYGAVNLTGSNIPVGLWGGYGHGGFRFTGVSGLSGSTITVATMTFTADASDSGSMSATMYGEDASAPGRFTLAYYNVTGRDRTTASVGAGSAEVGNWTSEAEYTLDVKTIIQEIAGNYDPPALVLLWLYSSGSGERLCYSYDGDSAKAVKLDITYTADVGDATLTAAGAALAAIAALPTAALTADATLSAGSASLALVEVPDATMTATVAGTLSADLAVAAITVPTASFTADATLSAGAAALAIVDVPAATIFAGGFDFPQVLGDEAIHVDRSEYATAAQFYLEVNMLTSNASQTARAKLYNVTDSTDVLGSDVSTTSTSFDRVRSAAFNLQDAKEYQVKAGGDVPGQYEFAGIPKLLVDE